MFQVHVEERFEAYRLRFFLMDGGAEWGGKTFIFDGQGRRFEIDPTRVLSEEQKVPLFEIHRDAAPALLAALSRHLGAVEHPEQLRRDYDAERARVDKFINHAIGGTR